MGELPGCGYVARANSAFRLLKFMGSNVVVTEGEQWRRHRRLTAPSFSEVGRYRGSSLGSALTRIMQRNNAMVWDDSRRVVQEWFAVLDLTTNANGACEDADTVQSTLRMALVSLSTYSTCFFGAQSLFR